MSPASENAGVWVQSPLGSKPFRISLDGQQVQDFSSSSDGISLVFSARNTQNGLDLWLYQRKTGSLALLVSCGTDFCFQPAWSPDGTKIAYTRLASEGNGLPGGQGRIWITEAGYKKTYPLSEKENQLGESPVWSPDGRWLLVIDPSAGGIRFINTVDWQSHVIPVRRPSLGGWSPDGKVFYFADLDSGSLPSFGTAFRVRADGWQVEQIFSQGPQLVDYAAPLISPDSEWLAVGLRFSGAGRQLWLLDESGSKQRILADNPLFSHGSYRWSKNGDRLLFQRIRLGSSQSRPEVLIWDRLSGGLIPVAPDAFNPHWLP